MTKPKLDLDEVLLRNVHPMHFDNGRITSAEFNPSANHSFKLSTDRETLCSAQEAFSRHVDVLGLQSIGVTRVSVSDFESQEIPCFDDPVEGNDAHALADYSAKGPSARKKSAKKISKIASEIGLVHEGK